MSAVFRLRLYSQQLLAAMTDPKAQCRETMKRLRAGLPAGDTAGQLAGHADALVRHFAISTGSVVAGYYPIGSEISPLPLLFALEELGMQTCLPVTPDSAALLLFRIWRQGDYVKKGHYGTSEPLPDAAEITPSILLVPLLAFDAAGYRLGYGGGYYDRTLAALDNATAIGIAYDEQEIAEVPRDAHDMPLHGILTPDGLRETG